MTEHAPCPEFDYVVDDSVKSFNIPKLQHIDNQEYSGLRYAFVATGAVVIRSTPSSPPSPLKVLLLQRSHTDSSPTLWETPGGACDDEDPTIIYGVARELWEEAGLKATRIGPRIGEVQVFPIRRGLVGKWSFLVDVEARDDGTVDVLLNETEHMDYLWATEEEVREHRVGEKDIWFTSEVTKRIILEGFRIKKIVEAMASEGYS